MAPPMFSVPPGGVPTPPPPPSLFGAGKALLKKAGPVVVVVTVAHKILTEPEKSKEIIAGPDPETVKAIKLGTQFGAPNPGALPKNPPVPSSEFIFGTEPPAVPQNPGTTNSRIYSVPPPYGKDTFAFDNFVRRNFGPRGSALGPLFNYTPPPPKGGQLFFAPVPRIN